MAVLHKRGEFVLGIPNGVNDIHVERDQTNDEDQKLAPMRSLELMSSSQDDFKHHFSSQKDHSFIHFTEDV